MKTELATLKRVSTHSRLKAAGVRRLDFVIKRVAVSTHSRLKAAGQ